ncbi:GNAT family N-acetyltransferase [Sphingomonas sp.]|uniref:GNAT family N-acetyltransferase n=1 Tax=Sphingomonas sp. TaxID=28214 RepID=UPI003D6CFFA9
MSAASRVAAARRWFRLLGKTPVVDHGAIVVADPSHPNVWDANFALAEPDADPDAVIAALDRAMPHSQWRVVVADALTDPAMAATLGFEGFEQAGPLIEMLASESASLSQAVAPITLRRATPDENWPAFELLVRADHREGLRTGPYNVELSNGLLATMRNRSLLCHYSIIALDGVDVGYGLSTRCPNGLGIIDELFTLPGWRGRGVMSAFIVAADRELRQAGCDGVFLDAFADDRPRLLYARLGFRPVAITCRWTKRLP